MNYCRKTLAFHNNDPDEQRAFKYLEKCPYHVTDVVTALVNDLLLEYGIDDPSALSKEEAMTMFQKRKKITAMDLVTAIKKSAAADNQAMQQNIVPAVQSVPVNNSAVADVTSSGSGATRKSDDEYVNENLANMISMFG